MNERQIKPIPIYTTHGDVGAYLVYPYIYNLMGEWIGWATSQKEVYSVLGNYVGEMSRDPRVLRKRAEDFSRPKKEPPAQPPRLIPPSSVPLAPMLPEISFDFLDVLMEQPDLLHTLDTGELKQDMD